MCIVYAFLPNSEEISFWWFSLFFVLFKLCIVLCGVFTHTKRSQTHAHQYITTNKPNKRREEQKRRKKSIKRKKRNFQQISRTSKAINRNSLSWNKISSSLWQPHGYYIFIVDWWKSRKYQILSSHTCFGCEHHLTHKYKVYKHTEKKRARTTRSVFASLACNLLNVRSAFTKSNKHHIKQRNSKQTRKKGKT